MKTKLFVLVFLTLLSLSALSELITFVPMVQASPDTLLSDDFEDCDVSDWTEGSTGDIYCDNARAHGGSYSGRHRRTGAGGSPSSWKGFTRKTDGTVRVIWWMQNDYTTHSHSVIIRDTVGGGYLGTVYMHKTGYFLAYKGGWVNVCAYSADTWYKIKTDNKIGLGKYDVYIYNANEELIGSLLDCDVLGTVNGLDEFRISSFDTGYYSWTDDIEVTYGAPPVFTPKQGHFKWYKDDWKTEDAQLTGVGDGDDLRFRLCIHETGGAAGSDLDVDMEYSDDKSAWVPLATQGGGGYGWVSPNGFEDPDAKWTDETKAYDNNEGTYAYSDIYDVDGWAGYLILTLANEIVSNKLRMKINAQTPLYADVWIDIYKDGEWVKLFEGNWDWGNWETKTFTIGKVSKVRVRFKTMYPLNPRRMYVYETDVWREERFRWRDDPSLTEHQAIDQARLSCTTENGKVHEQACTDSEDVSANTHHEISIILEPHTVEAGATYYFRVVLEGTPLILDSEVSEYVNLEVGDEIPPTYSNIGTNATEVNTPCEFSCYWEDETELSGFIFGTNISSAFSNDTWISLSGTASWANKTKTLPAHPYVVAYQWWCNDTSNNWNTTGTQHLNVTECYIVARFKYSPLRPYINENITFDGTYSVCSGSIDSYNWTFGDENSDVGSVVYHTYSGAGLYSVNLTVSGVNLTDSFVLQVNVTGYYDPIARFIFSPERPYISEDVSFNASTSLCLEGTITNYAWQFGDGNNGDGVTVTHNYTSANLFSVTLTITDNNTKTDSWTCKINVTDYIGPNARFVFFPSKPRFSDTITFNASSSFNPDGVIQTYSWTLGDGNSSSGVTTTHCYNTSGEFTVTLNVTDNHSKSDVFTATFNVTANMAPVAFFTYRPFFPFPNTPMHFYSDESIDPDGSISSYFWDFADNQNSSTANPSHTYITDGDFNVTFTITDNDGGTDVYSRVVRVSRGVGESEIVVEEKEVVKLIGAFYATCSVSMDGWINNYMDVRLFIYLENLKPNVLNVTVHYSVKNSQNKTVFANNETLTVISRQRQSYQIAFKVGLDSGLSNDIQNNQNYYLHVYIDYITEDGELVKSAETIRLLTLGSSHGFLRWTIGWAIVGVVALILVAIVWEIYSSKKEESRAEG